MHHSMLRPIVLAGLASALLTATGCGGGKATVTGKVVYNGRTVLVGSVILVGSDGVAVPANIESDGKFRVEGVRAGTVKVGVSTRLPDPGRGASAARSGPPAKAPGKAAAPDPNWFEVPDRFSDPNTSGVTIEVSSGSNDVTITLQ